MLSLFQVSELTPKYYLNVDECKTKGVLSVIYSSKINDVTLAFYHDCNIDVDGDILNSITPCEINKYTSYFSKNVVGVTDTDKILPISDDSYSSEQEQELYHLFCGFFNINVNKDEIAIMYNLKNVHKND